MNHTLDIYLDDLKYFLLNDYPEQYEDILLNDYYIRGELADLMGFKIAREKAYLNIMNRLENMIQELDEGYATLLCKIIEIIETSRPKIH